MQYIRKARTTLFADTLAGLTGAVAGAPQAIGFALLAGIAPVYGLYTAFVSTIVGAIFGSSVYMTVGPTNALALIVGSALMMYRGPAQAERLWVLTLLVGLFMLGFGVLRLGDLTRFVSNAVMTGFITGAGTLIILGQLGHLTGFTSTVPLLRQISQLTNFPAYSGSGGSLLQPTQDLLLHLQRIDPATTVIGSLAGGIIFVLHHTRFQTIAVLLALVVTTLLTTLFGLSSVELVGTMPDGLPMPILPNVALIPELIPVALAMAVLATVQSAGIVESMPQPDGDIPDASRDFTAQGVANIVTAFFQGMPAGGSLSRSAVNKSAGAKTRFANISAGVFVGLSLIAIGPLIELIPLTALAAHLIVAAFSLISIRRLRLVWYTGWTPRIAMVATFLSTLFLPLEYSIYVGVIISLAIYIYTSSHNISVRQLERVGDHQYREIAVPNSLEDAPNPLLLTFHGHLYFAAVKALEDTLPDVDESNNQVVILRLRHNQYLGSTGIRFLQRYAQRLRERGGRLIITGLSAPLVTQLKRTGTFQSFGEENIYDPEEIIFAAMEHAIADANDWLAAKQASQQPTQPPALATSQA